MNHPALDLTAAELTQRDLDFELKNILLTALKTNSDIKAAARSLNMAPQTLRRRCDFVGILAPGKYLIRRIKGHNYVQGMVSPDAVRRSKPKVIKLSPAENVAYWKRWAKRWTPQMETAFLRGLDEGGQ